MFHPNRRVLLESGTIQLSIRDKGNSAIQNTNYVEDRINYMFDHEIAVIIRDGLQGKLDYFHTTTRTTIYSVCIVTKINNAFNCFTRIALTSNFIGLFRDK